MRLYTRTGATALDDPEHGHFDADDRGGFDLPDELSDRLHRFHFHGRPLWETEIERESREIDEEMERRRDPATLMAAVQQIVDAAKATAPARSEAAAKRPAKRAASKPSSE